MCGRYALTTNAEVLLELFTLIHLPSVTPRYNIAPTQEAWVVRERDGAGRMLHGLRWGLIPAWTDGKTGAVGKGGGGAPLINARSETAATKPSFADAFRFRRCLVPADAFYEWKKLPGGGRQPYCVQVKGGPFALAGLWERWEEPAAGGDASPRVIESFTVLTTPPNALLQSLHDRMPAILEPGDYDLWLDPDVQDAERVQPLLKPLDPALMTLYPVSRRVNKPVNDDPACLERLPDEVGEWGEVGEGETPSLFS